MLIRPATETDAAAIRKVHEAAFPTAAEADLVEQLGRDGEAVVSLVAVDEGNVVGHILLSRMRVEADGIPVRGLGLAPVAVLPDRQHSGIGSTMIREAIAAARADGAAMIFVLGEPEYYGRFGFESAAAAPFRSPYAGPYFQALTIGRETALPARGRADYAPAFGALE